MVLRNSHGNLTGDKVYRDTVERHGRQTEKKLGCGEGDKRRQSSACSCRTPPQLCHDQSLGGGPAWTQPPRAPGPTRPLSKPIDQSQAGVCCCCPEGSNPHVPRSSGRTMLALVWPASCPLLQPPGLHRPTFVTGTPENTDASGPGMGPRRSLLDALSHGPFRHQSACHPAIRGLI